MAVNFDDMRLPYTEFTDSELRRLRALYLLLSRQGVFRVMSFLYKAARWTGLPVGWIVRPVVYNHFIGGPTIEECGRCVSRLGRNGIDSMLSYSVEMQKNEHEIRRLYETILGSVSYAAAHHAVPFVVFRPTSIIRKAVLEKKGLDIPLSAAEERQYAEYLARVNAICRKGSELGVKIIIDAERCSVQDTVDRTAQEMMRRYNRGAAFVFNTVQMYRSGRMDFLREAVADAGQEGYFYGVKLVRGAYLDYERQQARDKRYEDPILPSKAEVDARFGEALDFLVDRIDTVSLIMGSHNPESHERLIARMYGRGIAPSNPKIYFSHLYGMGDNLSYNLAAAGYNVVKYVPYGALNRVTPYVIRRVGESYVWREWLRREAGNIRGELERRRRLLPF